MINDRSSGIVNNADKYIYHILGCGAIGSSAATQIARMGGKEFYVYDKDHIEDVNVGVSQYFISDIGKEKTDALRELITNINPIAIVHTFFGLFSKYHPQGDNDIVILGFDSMDARMQAILHICSSGKRPKWIIDGRMGAEHYQQYVIQSPTVKKYQNTWYEDGSSEPCNAKATSFCSNMCGAFIANTVRKLITKQPYSRMLTFNFPTLILEKSKLIV